MKTDPIADKMLRDLASAREGGSPVQLVEDLIVNGDVIDDEARDALSKRPRLPDPSVEVIAKKTGLSSARAREIADEVSRGGEPALVVESYRAENEARDAFKLLYEEEIVRLQRCPLRVRRNGEWDTCGVELRDIQQALVHHSMHLMFESRDDRVRRAVTNDISEKLYPTDFKGVRAALTAEERTALFADPRMRDRLLRRGGRSVEDGVATDD